MYRYFYERNIAVDMIPFDADFTAYDLIAAPVLYMIKGNMQKALDSFVQSGGTLVTGYMSGIVDQSDNVHLGGYPGPLRKMAGIWAEEIDALAPEQYNTIEFDDGSKATCNLLCDIIHLEGAVSLAHYTSNFYAGSPVVTHNSYGKGSVYYIGAQLEAPALDLVMDRAAEGAGVHPVIAEKTELEITCRIKGATKYYFIMNFTAKTLPLPKAFQGKADILTGQALTAQTTAAPYTTYIVAEKTD